MFSLFVFFALITAPPVGMVDVKTVAPTVHVLMKYATSDNFLEEVFYEDDTCYLTPITAAKIAKAESFLVSQGFHLQLWDCARPVKVQHKMWDACVSYHGAEHCVGLVANPSKSKSRHTYGTTVDVSLVTYNGFQTSVPSKFDSGLFSSDTVADKSRARPPIFGSSIKPTLWDDLAWKNYQILVHAMTIVGFTGISSMVALARITCAFVQQKQFIYVNVR